MIPAFVVVGLGANPTNALVLSQVLLSLTLPIPMIALLLFTAQRNVMGDLVNGRMTTLLASIAAAIVLALNLVLLLQSAGLAF
jgi:manganese transport protein